MEPVNILFLLPAALKQPGVEVGSGTCYSAVRFKWPCFLLLPLSWGAESRGLIFKWLANLYK